MIICQLVGKERVGGCKGGRLFFGMDKDAIVFPDDENGDVLRRMQRDGDDFTKARDIDFVVVLPTGDAASKFSGFCRQLGLTASIDHSGCVKELPWDVKVIKHMLPSYAEITDFEDELQVVAEELGGRNDGWGCVVQNGKGVALASESSEETA
ncbi:MAG TPA: ribonuclease E inhibitor RraB [Acidobacteriaceae bacterium]|jgi:hypothetical protein